MARPLRVEFPDAIYHVTARGNERAAIVFDDHDRQAWLSHLERTVEVRGWRVFAFALMDNHFHIFIQTPEPNLSVGMHDLNGGYANWLNARHDRVGHLFQGRFKAVLVEGQGYWLEVSRYVHLNPVRAGLAAAPEAWRWSSYVGYHRPAKRLPWANYDRVLKRFGGDTPGGRRRYREFVAEGLGRDLDSPLSRAWHGLVLGSDAFVERVRELVEDRPEDREVPMLSRVRPRPLLEQVLAAVAEHYGVDRSAWAVGRRHDGVARSVAAYLTRQVAAAPAREIAKALGYRNVSSVSVACRRVRGAPRHSALASDIHKLTDRLTRRH